MTSVCSVCGNDANWVYTVATAEGSDRTYDSIECLAHDLAPRCPHCGCQVLGHGVETNGSVYCCRHCAAVTEVAAINARPNP